MARVPTQNVPEMYAFCTLFDPLSRALSAAERAHAAGCMSGSPQSISRAFFDASRDAARLPTPPP